MPALRERRSDVPCLVRHFVDIHNRRRHGQPLSVSDQAMVHLWEYDWPGNVRELENLMQRLAVLAEGPVIGVDDLPPAIRAITTPRQPGRLRVTAHGFDLQAAVEEFEHDIIAEAMRRTNGNKQAAARLLGVKRTTLVAKLRRHGLPDAAISA
jgi:DNA-binding NtrC family response regulator